MAQLIQLADGVMNRMEIEVSRDVIGVLIVCGMLHRAEVVDLHSSWHNQMCIRDSISSPYKIPLVDSTPAPVS